MTENMDSIGIICSQDLTEAYCIENSEYHKREIKAKRIETRIIYVSKDRLSSIILNSFNDNKFKLSIEKVLEYKIK